MNAQRKAEAKAWRRLAEWCANGSPARRSYLCDAMNRGWRDSDYDVIPTTIPLRDIRARMEAHVAAEHAESGNWCAVLGETRDGRPWYDVPPFTKRNDARVIFCLLMALECEDEADA